MKQKEKNKNFVVNFKILDDTLAQKVMKENMQNKFLGLEKNMFKEVNKFTNELGRKIILRLCPKEKEL